jgi:hypothetical protein
LIWYRIEAFRYLASRVRLGAMQLHSEAKGMTGLGQVLLFGLGFIGLCVVVSVAIGAIAAAGVPAAKAAITGRTLSPEVLIMIVVVALVPIYIILIWSMQLITYCWLWIPIIKHLATTLDVANFAAVDEIAQSTQPRQKLGIADSFELGAF